MANIDLIGLIASKCDIHAAMYLTTMNKYLYRELSKQRKRLRFEAVRNRIKDHVAELPSRLHSGRTNSVHWATYTIIKNERFVHVVHSDNGMYTAIVIRPVSIKYMMFDVNYVWIIAKQYFVYTTLHNITQTYDGIMIILDDRNIERAKKVLGGWRNYFKRLLHRFLSL
jgi:hypothetical protein